MIPPRIHTIESLDDLDYEAFTDLVSRDFHDQVTDDEAALLRRPENAVAWHRELVFILHDVEDQIAQSRLADDPEVAKKKRLLKLRTIHKHIQRAKHEAKFTMDQLGLVDASAGTIVGILHDLEHVLDEVAVRESRIEDARHLLDSLLDRLPELIGPES